MALIHRIVFAIGAFIQQRSNKIIGLAVGGFKGGGVHTHCRNGKGDTSIFGILIFRSREFAILRGNVGFQIGQILIVPGLILHAAPSQVNYGPFALNGADLRFGYRGLYIGQYILQCGIGCYRNLFFDPSGVESHIFIYGIQIKGPGGFAFGIPIPTAEGIAFFGRCIRHGNLAILFYGLCRYGAAALGIKGYSEFCRRRRLRAAGNRNGVTGFRCALLHGIPVDITDTDVNLIAGFYR